jgi:subtilisin family serine protease
MPRNQLNWRWLVNRTKRLFSYGVLPLLVVLALGPFVRASLFHETQIVSAGRDKIGPGILDTLQTGGEVRIVIALVQPLLLQADAANLSAVRDEIALTQASLLSSVDPGGFALMHKFEAVPALVGTLLSETVLEELAAHPLVVKIDLDEGGSGELGVSVPLIGADTWHDVGNRAHGVTVAVLDSGLDTTHADFAQALIHEECFLDNDGSINGIGLCPNGSDRQSGDGAAQDDAGHGTHVTGVIASRGNNSSIGVAPGAGIISIKVLAGPSFSGVFYYFTEIVAALDFIITNRPDVHIINMSLGTFALFSGDCDNTTAWNMAGASAVNTLRSMGVVAFASAGNNGSGISMTSPACLSSVIAVGATNNSDLVAPFSNSNSSTDLLAPGVGITSSAIGNDTTTASGTSMASPHAAGCAALLIASQEAITPEAIENRLKNSPVHLVDSKNGLTFPRIDCTLRQTATGVSITGPDAGIAGYDYIFVAATNPITATLPITYTWQATEHLPVTNTNGISNTASLIWETPGTKVITVTAQNLEASVTGVYTIGIISAVAPASLDISGPETGIAGQVYSFFATVSPITTTQPITYIWQATGQMPITNTSGISNTASFVWHSPGLQVITIAAQNREAEVTNSYSILVSTRIYLPTILRR